MGSAHKDEFAKRTELTALERNIVAAMKGPLAGAVRRDLQRLAADDARERLVRALNARKQSRNAI